MSAPPAGPRPVVMRGPRVADVTRDAVLVWRLVRPGGTRTVLFWRTRRGQPVATDARCPHGGYLMVDAQLVGGGVECPRHGYRFRADGRCANVRNAPRAVVLDVRESDGYLWIAV